MTENEDFIIKDPYQPTPEENQAIKSLENNGRNLIAKDWNSQGKHIKSFKQNLRNDMYNKQNKLCAYCRIHVPLACVPMHREHIVYKNKHPQWIFLPKNLCVACPSCNEFKGVAEVLTDPNTKTYPKTGEGFKIIHPFYDKYSDHIELIDGILYQGKTAKGAFTIKTCHLHRVQLAEERVDKIMYEQNKEDITANLIHLLNLSSLKNVDDTEEFIQYVKNLVRKYKRESQKRNL